MDCSIVDGSSIDDSVGLVPVVTSIDDGSLGNDYNHYWSKTDFEYPTEELTSSRRHAMEYRSREYWLITASRLCSYV